MKAFKDVTVGDVIKVIKNNSFVPLNMYGVVYERYRFASFEGVSVIFENGKYDGWSEKDFGTFLMPVFHCTRLKAYDFRNVQQVVNDFTNGIFKPAFEMAANPTAGGESLLW